VQHLVAVSPYVKKELGPLTRAAIDVIENPVGAGYFEASADPSDGEPRLLFAGSLIEKKNVLGLLRVVDILRHRLPSVSLRIAGGPGRGEPHYRRRLAQFISGRGLQKEVALLGQLREQELCREYAQSSVVVSCSYEETSGLVVQQAMAAGRACVATRNGGFSSVVKDGSTGFLVEPDDDARFAQAVELILRDPSLRLRMGLEARRAALHRFAPAVAAEKTLRLYERLLAR
jgi:glycosyltransferase involved in cell wall biosynthesis